VSRRINRHIFGRRRSWLGRRPRLQDRVRQWFGMRHATAVRMNANMILCRILGPYKLCVDPDDLGITPHLVMDGFWEPRVTETIVDRLRPGMTAIDAGANLGYFTVLMAALAGMRGRVVAFEPVPATADLLAHSIRLNGFAQVTLYREPLAEVDGREVTLVFEPHYRGGASVSAHPARAHQVSAKTRRLDRVPGALDAALVKIDTEGSEEAVWRGMSAMIAGRALRWVIVEFTRASYDDPAGFLAEAQAAGFTLLRIDDERGPIAASAVEILAGPALQMLLFER
jgi:FkbM family methyltransferase